MAGSVLELGLLTTNSMFLSPYLVLQKTRFLTIEMNTKKMYWLSNNNKKILKEGVDFINVVRYINVYVSFLVHYQYSMSNLPGKMLWFKQTSPN